MGAFFFSSLSRTFAAYTSATLLDGLAPFSAALIAKQASIMNISSRFTAESLLT